MHTSELSNALNPYATQSRNHAPKPNYPPPSSSQQYLPHRSELELAVAEPVVPPPPPPPPPPPSLPITTVRPKQPTSGSIQAVQELLRIVAATRESQEIERKRRLAWEQEQEAKYTQRQAEMERQMLEMRQELSMLRSITSVNHAHIPSVLLTPQFSMSPALAVQRPSQLASPISPMSQPSHSHSMFEQGSASQHQIAYDSNQSRYYEQTSSQPLHPPSSVTPSPSPQLVSVQTSQVNSPAPSQGQGTSSQLSSDEEDGNNSETSASTNTRRIKRVSHHDKRCLTIHHALRAHILRLMNLESDKELPDSHEEGAPLGPHEPVRFVWDKTAKQSVHNARMKARIISDIKANRKLYKHVPDRDFSKKTLDAAFDQSFITFRQKFRTQRDTVAAAAQKKREALKAQKARHLSRRRIKLSNRADARMKIVEFEHVTFDGALQIDCMSSEESDLEESSSHPLGMLRTRGYLWRSSRLLRFYNILDDEEKADKSNKPKRGIGKKERYVGSPKDGFQLPPQGVASWMISKRWLRTSHAKYPDLSDALARNVQDPPGFDWGQFQLLGEESDDSTDNLQTYYNHPHPLPPSQLSASSLGYALV